MLSKLLKEKNELEIEMRINQDKLDRLVQELANIINITNFDVKILTSLREEYEQKLTELNSESQKIIDELEPLIREAKDAIRNLQ